MLYASCSRDLFLRVLHKYTVAYERKILLFFCVVNWYYKWSILQIVFRQVIFFQCRQLKINISKAYFLLHSRWEINILHIVLSIWSIEHNRNITFIFLLCYTSTYSDIAVHLGVHFETQLQHFPFYICFYCITVNIAFQIKSL